MTQRREALLQERPFLKLYTSKDLTRIEVNRELTVDEIKDFYQSTHISRVLEVLIYHPKVNTPQTKHQNLQAQVQALVNQGLKYNKSLKVVDLDGAGIDHTTMAAMKELLLNNKGITHLLIGHNSISKEYLTAISEGLSDGSSLIMLDVTQTNINDPTMETLASALTKHEGITVLNIGHNNLSPASAPHIKKMIEEHSRLTHVDVGNTQLGNDGIKALMGALGTSEVIKEVCIRSTNINHDAAPSIAEFVEKSKSLRKLDLSKNQQLSKQDAPTEGIALIAEALEESSIEALNMSGSLYYPLSQGEQSGKIIAVILCKSKSIKFLDVSENSITFVGAQLVADALPQNTSVGHIAMKQTGLDEAGAILLSKGLETNKSMEYLGWAQNGIRDAGVIFIAATLQAKNHTIRFLDLSGNSITEKGVAAICEILDQLEVLNLSNNQINQPGAEALASKLPENKSLRELHLDQTQIGPQGAVAIVTALAGHNFLKILSLCSNNVGDHGLEQMLAPLTKNMSIIDLKLATNNLTTASGQKFVTLVRGKKSLVKLDFGNNQLQDKEETEIADAVPGSSLQEIDGLKDNQMHVIIALLRNKDKIQSQLRALEKADAQFTYQELFVLARSMQLDSKFGPELSYVDLKTGAEYMQLIAGKFKTMNEALKQEAPQAEEGIYHKALLDSNLLGLTE